MTVTSLCCLQSSALACASAALQLRDLHELNGVSALCTPCPAIAAHGGSAHELDPAMIHGCHSRVPTLADGFCIRVPWDSTLLQLKQQVGLAFPMLPAEALLLRSSAIAHNGSIADGSVLQSQVTLAQMVRADQVASMGDGWGKAFVLFVDLA